MIKIHFSDNFYHRQQDPMAGDLYIAYRSEYATPQEFFKAVIEYIGKDPYAVTDIYRGAVLTEYQNHTEENDDFDCEKANHLDSILSTMQHVYIDHGPIECVYKVEHDMENLLKLKKINMIKGVVRHEYIMISKNLYVMYSYYQAKV